MEEYRVGDVVWSAYAGTKLVKKPCDVCFGKLSVILELGNGERIKTDCDYCGNGHEGPQGFNEEYEYITEATQKTITQIEVTETGNSRKLRYQSHTQILERDMIFDTEEEAIEKSKRAAIEHNKDAFERAEGLKENSYKSYSWHVGYYRREAKRNRESAERCERKATACKEKAKDKAVSNDN